MSEPKAAGELRFHGPARLLLRLGEGFALAGGGLFIAMVGLSCVSIVGRKLWSAPIDGDIELLQMGTAIAAAAFFPLCTMTNEHLRVDFFTDDLSRRTNAVLDGVANLLLAVMMALLSWRGVLRVEELKEAGEVTTMRNIEVWIPVAWMIPSLVLTSICALERSFHHFTVGRVAR